MNRWLKYGKDEDPAKTIKKIEKILHKLGITLKKTNAMSNIGGCYSTRFEVDGELSSFFGTNGKGLSETLSKASCLGEMIERLSNKLFDAFLKISDGKHLFYEDIYPLYDLLSDKQEDIIKNIIDKYVASTNMSALPLAKEVYVVNTLCEIANNKKKNHFYTVPFYSVSEKKVVYLPERLLIYVTGSTGAAAGNTLEEALVQGLSEIMERYSYYKLLEGDIVPPHIPDEIIKNYPKINALIKNIKKNKIYDIHLFDASLDMGLPVICLVIVNKITGSLGIKLGAHPNMEIAIQRVFTEALQGKTIDDFINTNYFTFEDKEDFVNIYRQYKYGIGFIHTNLFNNKPSYEFNMWKDVNGMSNKDLLKHLLDILKNNNSNVYIRDVSYTGFPSVYIYASNFSDILANGSLLKYKRVIQRGKNIFKKIDGISKDELLELKNTMILLKNFLDTNPMMILSGYYYNNKNEIFGVPYEADAFLMIIEYMLGDIESSIKRLKDIIIKFNEKTESEKIEYYSILLKYFESIYYKTDINETKKILYNIFDKKIVDKVYNDFNDTDKILAKLYTVCKNDCTNCKNENCKMKEINNLFDTLMNMEKNNPCDYNTLAKILE